MNFLRKAKGYFSKGELVLLISSVVLIITAFVIFDRENLLTLAASLIGAASLIFCAKGHPAGQFLMTVFSIMYGIISYSFAYYGEMITYLGMTAPMAVLSLVSWLRNPYSGESREVKVNRIGKGELTVMILLTAAVTAAFYFILGAFGTANLIPSTVSVTTSFAAAYLTFRRSPFYALLYACNDAVLILLWVLAAMEDRAYISVAVCFVMFLANDLYGFVSWRRMEKRQKAG